MTNTIELSSSQAQRMTRSIQALQRRIRSMHEQRNIINQRLARVTENNLGLALTQKKNLKALSKDYDKLTQEVLCLDPLDAAQILEEEYNYILTIGNILETTRELKKTVGTIDSSREAIKDGLIKFYEGLRAELSAAKNHPNNTAPLR